MILSAVAAYLAAIALIAWAESASICFTTGNMPRYDIPRMTICRQQNL